MGSNEYESGDKFLVFTEYTSYYLEVPREIVSSTFSPRTPDLDSYEGRWAWNQANDPEFADRLIRKLHSFTGGDHKIVGYERRGSVEIKSVKYNNVKYNNANAAGVRPQAQKESKMTKSVADIGKEAIIRGGQKAVVNQASELLLDTFAKVVGHETASAMLANEQIRNLVKITMAMAYLQMGQSIDKLPMNDSIKFICESLIEGGAQQFIEPNIEALVKHMPDMVSQLSQLGKKIEDGNFIELAADVTAIKTATQEMDAVSREEVEEEVPAASKLMSFR